MKEILRKMKSGEKKSFVFEKYSSTRLSDDGYVICIEIIKKGKKYKITKEYNSQEKNWSFALGVCDDQELKEFFFEKEYSFDEMSKALKNYKEEKIDWYWLG